MTSETDIAYIAGLVDGEGYIGIKRASATERNDRTTRGYHARIAIKMNCEAAIRFVSETLGGWYWQEKAGRTKPMFVYQATDKVAENILRTLVPYLRVKRDVALTVLELRNLQSNAVKYRTKITGYREFPNRFGTVRIVPNLSYSDEYVAMCDALYERCKAINALD